MAAASSPMSPRNSGRLGATRRWAGHAPAAVRLNSLTNSQRLLVRALIREMQPAEPIPCRCSQCRKGLLGDHRDHRAELRRNQAAGAVADEVYFASIAPKAPA